MRALKALLALTAVIAILLAIVASPVLLLTSRTPLVSQTDVPPPPAEAVARQLVGQPLAPGAILRITLDQPSLNAWLLHAISRSPLAGKLATEVTLADQEGRLRASLALPGWLSGRYLNLDLDLGNGEPGRLQPRALQANGWPLPVSLLADQLPRWREWVLRAPGGDRLLPLVESLQSLQLAPDGLHASITLTDTLSAKMNQLLNQQMGDLSEAAAVYVDLAAHEIAVLGNRVSLASLMPVLAQRAMQRSQFNGQTMEENRALIHALAVLTLHHPLSDSEKHPVPEATFVLHGRQDLARHFVGAAMLALLSDARTASMLGLAKETHDANGGTGFNPVDLLAGEAGARFASLAVTDDLTARAWQSALTQLSGDADLFPRDASLPPGADPQQALASVVETTPFVQAVAALHPLPASTSP